MEADTQEALEAKFDREEEGKENAPDTENAEEKEDGEEEATSQDFEG